MLVFEKGRWWSGAACTLGTVLCFNARCIVNCATHGLKLTLRVATVVDVVD
jgi:hypothetical protein